MDSSREAYVLCVEDDAGSRAIVAAALKKHQVEFAVDGSQALQALQRTAFDLVVLDQWLPDYDGIGLCREIRRNDPHVPIIVLSITDRAQLGARAGRAGASAYLQKSPDYQLLQQLAAELIASAALKAEAAEAAATAVLEHISAGYGERPKAHDLSAEDIEAMAVRFGRGRAWDAFFEAGGTRAQFERWWATRGGVTRPVGAHRNA